MKKHIFKSLNGNEFCMDVLEECEVSPLEGGYIITPEGLFIPIKDTQDHSDIFSQYLSGLYDKQISVDTIGGMAELIKNGHAVYMGIKIGDVKNMSDDYTGVLVLPPTFESSSIELKNAIGVLLKSNKSIFGDREKIPMEYHILDFNDKNKDKSDEITKNNKDKSDEITKEELLNMINSKVK